MANATIEDRDFTLFLDYDRASGALAALSDNGKIDWLEQRMNMIFLKPITRIVDRNSAVFAQLEHPADSRPMTAMLMAVSLLMNAMEALGSFLVGPFATNGMRFHAFVRKYMPDWNTPIPGGPIGNRSLADVLWKCYRNGLAHAFAVTNAGIEHIHGPDKYHLKAGVLEIDAWKLFSDLQTAIAKLFYDARNDPSVRQTFLRRFNSEYM